MENNTAENRLKRTFFIVEANSFEVMSLWRDHAKQSDRANKFSKQDWEQMPDGWPVTVGKLGKRPCCIDVRWFKIDGYLVMFYDQCSQVSDSIQTEKWLSKHFKGTYDSGTRRAWTDAMNFGHCLHAIKEQKEIDSWGNQSGELIMRRIERFLLRWLCERLVRQGFDHKNNITEYFAIMQKAIAKEFREDNTAGHNSLARECLLDAQR